MNGKVFNVFPGQLETYPASRAVAGSNNHSAGPRTLRIVRTRRRQALVVPFFVEMMGTNARDAEAPALQAIVAAGRSSTANEVVALLQGEWHETAMGAWYALFHDPQDVGSEIEAALSRTKGSLPVPALTVALVVLARHKAIPPLRDYLKHHDDDEFGSWGFVRAAAEHLGAVMTHRPPTESERDEFNELLAIAERLPRDEVV
jgi:hypothetical protein